MNSFKKNIINLYGNQGKTWLTTLPELITQLANQYQLTDLQPVANMSFNYVASAVKQGQPVIIKLGLNEKALTKEVACLQAFKRHGAVEVIAHDSGMILMQRANPGTTLKTLFPKEDQTATAIVCNTIQQLQSAEIPKQQDFYHLKTLLSILDNDLNIPTDIISKAKQLRDSLLASTEKTVLLHGDLHHENILKHDDGWLMIDPQGFIGDPVFEVCAFILNPIPQLLEQTNVVKIIDDRIQHCVNQLGFPRQRIHDWLLVKSVLCWAWCLDDNIDPRYFEQIHGILLTMS